MVVAHDADDGRRVVVERGEHGLIAIRPRRREVLERDVVERRRLAAASSRTRAAASASSASMLAAIAVELRFGRRRARRGDHECVSPARANRRTQPVARTQRLRWRAPTPPALAIACTSPAGVQFRCVAVHSCHSETSPCRYRGVSRRRRMHSQSRPSSDIATRIYETLQTR